MVNKVIMGTNIPLAMLYFCATSTSSVNIILIALFQNPFKSECCVRRKTAYCYRGVPTIPATGAASLPVLQDVSPGLHRGIGASSLPAVLLLLLLSGRLQPAVLQDVPEEQSGISVRPQQTRLLDSSSCEL